MSENIFSLTATPSFFDGFVRVLDLTGSLNIYNTSPTEAEADIKALRSDWEAIGNDLGAAIEKEKKNFEHSTNEK